jgi:hypothetical protein
MTANVMVMPDAPQHLVDQAHAVADFVHDKFGVTQVTVHDDHVVYHDMVKPTFWDDQLALYTRHKGEDVLRTDVTDKVSWDQVPQAHDPKKRKKK